MAHSSPMSTQTFYPIWVRRAFCTAGKEPSGKPEDFLKVLEQADTESSELKDAVFALVAMRNEEANEKARAILKNRGKEDVMDSAMDELADHEGAALENEDIEDHPLQENFDRFKKKLEENKPFHDLSTNRIQMVMDLSTVVMKDGVEKALEKIGEELTKYPANSDQAAERLAHAELQYIKAHYQAVFMHSNEDAALSMEKAFEALPSGTRFPAWRLYQAGILSDLNKAEEAIAACDKAIEDSSTDNLGYIKSSSLLKKAELLLKLQKNEEALAASKEVKKFASSVSPSDVDLCFIWGQAVAVELQGSMADLFLAAAYARIGKYFDALATLQSIHAGDQKNPVHARHRLGVGSVFYLMGNREEAENRFEDAADEFFKDHGSDRLGFMAKAYAACCRLAAKHPEKEWKAIGEMMKFALEDPLATHTSMDYKDDKIPVYASVVQEVGESGLDKDSTEAIEVMALVNWIRYHTDAAGEYVEKLVQQKPTDTRILWLATKCASMTGQYENAEKYCLQVLEHEQNEETVEEYLSILHNLEKYEEGFKYGMAFIRDHESSLEDPSLSSALYNRLHDLMHDGELPHHCIDSEEAAEEEGAEELEGADESAETEAPEDNMKKFLASATKYYDELQGKKKAKKAKKPKKAKSDEDDEEGAEGNDTEKKEEPEASEVEKKKKPKKAKKKKAEQEEEEPEEEK